MTKELDETNTNPSPIMASMAGAVVGAGLGATGALILKDKKNRAKVKEVLAHFKDQINGYSEKRKREVEKSIHEGEMKARKITEIAKDTIAQGAIESKDVLYAK